MNQTDHVSLAAWVAVAQEKPNSSETVLVPGVAPDAAHAPVTQTPTTGAPGSQPVGAPPASPFGGLGTFAPLIAVFAVVIGMQILGARKDKKRRQALISGLAKNDQVVTMSGIIGTVAEIADDTVVIRLEDGRMRVSKAAIQSVVPSREHAKGNAGELEVKSSSREKTHA